MAATGAFHSSTMTGVKFMRLASAIMAVALCLSAMPVRAELNETPEVNPNEASNDACASAAAFIIAPQVFLAEDEKKLPEWIRLCNANADQDMCKQTIRIISENQKNVPPELKCDLRS
jgi:hypothetical protein